MKKTVDEKLNDIFEIDASDDRLHGHSTIVASEWQAENENIIEVMPVEQPREVSNVEDDYEYARNNLKGLIENGKSVIENIMYLAKEGESPRAYEVAGQLIKTIADTNKDLLDLSKKVKDVKKDTEVAEKSGVTNVNNTLFVGSTAELQKLIGK